MATRKRTADKQEHSDTLRNTKELHYNIAIRMKM